MAERDETASLTSDKGNSAGAGVAVSGSIGRFVVTGPLGAGGMGVVVAAYDPTLDRKVALKLLRVAGGAESRARLLREAQAMARLQHPHVAIIHEVGELGDQLFVAMELVDGQTLQGWLTAPETKTERTPREVLAMFSGAGRGLAAVHDAGLVHRDFKPHNVLVGADGRPRVSDFGLVSSGAESGSRAGTPAYMAPEQRAGGTVDARSDQYAFCVALQAALARCRGVPAYVAPLLARGLAADPGARWPSLTALLDALAIDPGARRRRWLMVAAALVMAALALVAVRDQARPAAAARMRAAASLGREVETLRSGMRAAHLLPAHDIRREREQVRTQLMRVAAQAAALGDDGRAAGEFALGAGELALGAPERARPHLEAAWAAGERGPDLAYDLGLVLGITYQRAIQDMPPMPPDDEKRHVEELRRTLRDPAIERLRAAQGAAGTSPAYVRALIAFYERRYDDALGDAERAFAESPTLYEAGQLAARVYAQKGMIAANDSKSDEAHAQFARAAALFDRVEETARSDEATFRVDGDLLLQIASTGVQLGDDPRPLLHKVIAGCDRALTVDSEATWPDEMKPFALWQLAMAESHAGHDPRPPLEEAIATAERAIGRDAKSSRGRTALGEAWLSFALECQLAHGEDPSAALERAVASFTASLALRPDPLGYRDRGYALANIARWRMGHGQDAAAQVNAAVASSADAQRINPDDPSSDVDACAILADFAATQLEHGHDPEPLLAQADARCLAAHALASGQVIEAYTRAEIEMTRARVAWRHGEDPRPSWSRAEVLIERALALDQKRASTYVHSARLATARARYATSHALPAADDIAHARHDAAESVRLDGHDASEFAAQAGAELTAAATDRGAFARGRQAVTRALALDAHYLPALLIAAALDLANARQQKAHRRSPAVAVAAGRAHVALLLTIDPTSAHALMLGAALAELDGDAPAAATARAAALALDPQADREPL